MVRSIRGFAADIEIKAMIGKTFIGLVLKNISPLPYDLIRKKNYASHLSSYWIFDAQSPKVRDRCFYLL